MKFSLILPCYNEISHLPISIEMLFEDLKTNFAEEDFVLIFVDDGSLDGTPAFLRQLPQRYPKMKIKTIFLQENRGRGGAIQEGLKQVQSKFAGYMDIDSEISCLNIPAALELLMGGADLVVGRRRHLTSPWQLGGLLRILRSSAYARLSSWIFPLKKGIDSEAGFKFFGTAALEVGLRQCQFQNWFWDTEFCVLCRLAQLHVQELQVEYVIRRDKKTSVRPIYDVMDYLRSMWLFKLRLMRRRT